MPVDAAKSRLWEKPIASTGGTCSLFWRYYRENKDKLPRAQCSSWPRQVLWREIAVIQPRRITGWGSSMLPVECKRQRRRLSELGRAAGSRKAKRCSDGEGTRSSHEHRGVLPCLSLVQPRPTVSRVWRHRCSSSGPGASWGRLTPQQLLLRALRGEGSSRAVKITGRGAAGMVGAVGSTNASSPALVSPCCCLPCSHPPARQDELGRCLRKRRDQSTPETSEKHQGTLCGLLSSRGGGCQVTWTRWYVGLWPQGQRWPWKPLLCSPRLEVPLWHRDAAGCVGQRRCCSPSTHPPTRHLWPPQCPGLSFPSSNWVITQVLPPPMEQSRDTGGDTLAMPPPGQLQPQGMVHPSTWPLQTLQLCCPGSRFAPERDPAKGELINLTESSFMLNI